MTELAGRALLSLGCFVVIGSLLMLPFTQGGTGERLISWIALGIGLVAVAGAIIAIRSTHRRRDRAMTAHSDDHVVTTKEES